jgi:hypothetical protein
MAGQTKETRTVLPPIGFLIAAMHLIFLKPFDYFIQNIAEGWRTQYHDFPNQYIEAMSNPLKKGCEGIEGD